MSTFKLHLLTHQLDADACNLFPSVPRDGVGAQDAGCKSVRPCFWRTHEEVKLEKTGEWSPKAVFRIVYMADVMSVEMELESEDDVWNEDN